MALVDEVWGRMAFRTPWSGGREREAVARALDPVPRLARPARRPHGGRHRAAAPRRGDAARRPAGPPARVRRPARARRRRPRRGRRPQDRQVPADRTRRRASTPSSASTSSPSTTAPSTSSPADRPARAAPSWSSCAGARRRAAQGPARRRRRSPDDDGVTPVEEQLMAAARAVARRGVRGPPRRPLRPLRVPARSAPPRPPGRCCRDAATRPAIDTPAELRQLLRRRLRRSAPQQCAAITAPLEPAVVIAGAGSGKTTVMAARVVWLVATGQVAPDQVLGLTFTTKATAELRSRIRDALAPAGLLPERGDPGGDDERGGRTSRRSRPTTPTPPRCSPSTACGSATSPTPGVIADAVRYQLAARAVDRYTRPVEQLTDSPPPRRSSTCSRSTAR